MQPACICRTRTAFSRPIGLRSLAYDRLTGGVLCALCVGCGTSPNFLEELGHGIEQAIEAYLRENYVYTLDLKAGGPDPLADFVFNVKQGHCEYFATAMAVMVRTQGIASRVVNGFLPGEYNEAAGAYTVRQSDAHSWVEVYFPQTDSWVTFDPTPPAGRTAHVRSGLAGALSKYSEALELMWFQ